LRPRPGLTPRLGDAEAQRNFKKNDRALRASQSQRRIMKISMKTTIAAAGIGLALFTSACATRDTVRLMRQPAMPPVAVPKASPLKDFYRNVSIQEVEGAPEFRWFDGGAVVTTRPTRVQVLQFLTRELDSADLLAPKRIDSEYMLYVKFEELRGPNVWLFTDKLASARVTFRLVRWRTGQLVREKTFETSYVAKFPGIPPEVVRAAIAGPIGASKDRVIAPVGGAIGGATQAWLYNHAIYVYAVDGDADGDVDDLRVKIGKAIYMTDFEALLAGGLLGAITDGVAAAEAMPVGATEDEYIDGRTRRLAATWGLMNLLLDKFLVDLSKDGEVVLKTAVSCRSLNPGSYTYTITETADSVGVDCPGAHYFVSPTYKAKPSLF
jgi:hypothetical protein